ncbi:MAG: hypothetical protein ABIJ16_09980 [Bacteroidota bacterium]
MTRIESDKKTVNKPDEILFGFLCNLNNWEQLMPDRVADWKSTETSCYFSIKGTANLGMRIYKTEPYSGIMLADDGKVPFPFRFEVIINKLDYLSSEILFAFEADLNPMLKMLAVAPLKNFLNMIADKLQNIEIM